MSIGALVGAASALSGAGAKAVEPAYGLGFRFTVKIDANPVKELGAWQSCSGLKVEFKSTEVKQGGSYLSQTRLPDKVVYPKVTLKRAVLASSSSKVQKWLTEAARDWLSDKKSVASDATITLYDSNDKPVLEWILKRARPSAWSGPDLDATSSKVAIETLELEHEGFEVKPSGDSPGGSPSTGPPGKQAVPILSEGSAKVEFSFAPDKLTLDIRAKELRGSQAGTADQATAGFLSGVTSYKLSDLILQGPNTKKQVTQLATWATAVAKKSNGKPSPCPPDPARSGSANKATKPGGDKEQPHIQFKWGPTFNLVVQVKQLTASYTRFTPDGQPIRATIGLTLQVIRELPTIGAQRANGAANPTSGGIAGRASHLLTASDTLPLLAREHYGNPDSWRDIAAANGIDDPLRVRPGRLLYLPADSELTNGRRA